MEVMEAIEVMEAMEAMAAMAAMTAVIIDLHSIPKKKNYIYWQKCLKSDKVACCGPNKFFTTFLYYRFFNHKQEDESGYLAKVQIGQDEGSSVGKSNPVFHQSRISRQS